MELRSLASGSSGNAYLVRDGRTSLLIDAGISARRLEAALRAEGLEPRNLTGIIISHEHSDHVRGAAQFALRHHTPVHTSAGTYQAMGSPATLDWRALSGSRTVTIGTVEVTPIDVPHDAAEPLVFRLEANHAAIAIATDFGCPTEAMHEAFAELELLVLEANHDEEWLWRGSYPWSLKKRVAGERGHISNETAAGIIAGLGGRAPRSVWLAHLSKHNNAPEHALRVVGSSLARSVPGPIELLVAERDHVSLKWTSDTVTRQLALNLH
ncbi:MAG: MBL fold metallo-hydrolase [Chloroflexota bacterium]